MAGLLGPIPTQKEASELGKKSFEAVQAAQKKTEKPKPEKPKTTATGGKAKPTPAPADANAREKPTATGARSYNAANVAGYKESSNVDLRYPAADIHEDTDYLEIQILKYIPAGFTKQENVLKQGVGRASSKISGNKKNILGTIKLPIPQNIRDLNATGWGDDSLNTAAAYAAAATGGVMFNEGGFIDNIIKAVKQTGADAQNLLTDGTTQSAIQSAFTSATANLLGANTTVEGLLARAEGVILNPNKELLFNGVSLRDFSFTFDMAPRNDTEAEQIRQIIRVLKKNMAPVTANATGTNGDIKSTGLFLRSPNVFQLTYKTGAGPHPFLNKFKLMALTNMGVNYTGSGTYMTYNDGVPVHIQMTLNFKELDPVYAEDYDSKSAGPGVGY